ncbi:MAG TPA: exonuclease SbcCD subunit D [Methanocorpusculum sp.]|nr:exonuclease SbcCD subunit D [Methanocorpusculum sp.]
MKLLHTADLHIGKRLGERDLMEDQKYILGQIVEIIDREHVDALLIAGDVYDRSAPSAEAIALFEDFLTALAFRTIPVFIIYGNHDSAERLSYGSKIFALHDIHITDRYEGTVPQITLNDAFGPVHIHLLPNLRVQGIKAYFPDAGIETLDEAIRTVIDTIDLNPGERNILVAHQFVVNGSERPVVSESEISSVGDSEEIAADIFRNFDYVALGHLHGPQHIGPQTVRYSGSPLKYSKSEAHQHKSVTLVTLNEKNATVIEEIPLEPLRDVREIIGPISNLISREVLAAANREDYVYVTYTDEIPDEQVVEKISSTYPNYVRIERRVSADLPSPELKSIAEIEHLDPQGIFREFYEKQRGEPMTDLQQKIVTDTFREIETEGLQ